MSTARAFAAAIVTHSQAMEDYEAAEIAVSCDMADAVAAAADAAGGWTGGSKNSEYQFVSQENVLGRRCIWSHHICCPFKRRYIQQCARCDRFVEAPWQRVSSCVLTSLRRELRLGGWSKIGFPGVIVVEGASCAALCFDLFVDISHILRGGNVCVRLFCASRA